MKSKQIVSILLVLVMVVFLVACGDSNGDNSKKGSTPKVSSSGDSTPPSLDDNKQGSGNTIDKVIEDFWNASEVERELSLEIIYIDEQSGDVFLTFKKPQTRCDAIEVLRGSGNEMSVIASFVDVSDTYYQMYIDKGAAGQDYYYAVRGVADVVGAIFPKQLTYFVNRGEFLWYKGEDGYIRRDDRFTLDYLLTSDELIKTELINQMFMRFDADGQESNDPYFYNLYSDGVYIDRARAGNPMELDSRTDNTSKTWDYGFYESDGMDISIVINYDDESFEWGKYELDAETLQGFTIDHFYTRY